MALPKGAKVLNEGVAGDVPDEAPKPSKFHNVRAEVDGIMFDSKKEARRYKDLKLDLAAGNIQQLETHPSYEMHVNGQLICKYEADFSYYERGDDRTFRRVIEDVKGHRTREYIIKKRLMKAIYDIEIRET